LDKVGIKEAGELAKLFEHVELSHIFCSDKQRATKTAEIVGKAHGASVHPVESLRALDVGEFSGQKRTPEAEANLQTYLESPDTQIPGGESLNEFKQRIGPCLQQAVEMFSKTGVPPLLVAHSSIVHEVGALLKGGHKNLLVSPGGAIAIFFNGSKLDAEPIFKPLTTSKTHAETIT
jgi:probable phosphoglycerate mutase